MLKLNELRQNPVIISVTDKNGQSYIIMAERRLAGRVKLDCSCPESATIGWCYHRLHLICERILNESNDETYALSDILLDTPLQDAAEELKAALERFTEAYREMMQRLPKEIVVEALEAFSDTARDTGEWARELANAIGSFVSKLNG